MFGSVLSFASGVVFDLLLGLAEVMLCCVMTSENAVCVISA